MQDVNIVNFNDLADCSNNNSYLSIVERMVPKESNLFFSDLLKNPFNINTLISKENALKDINKAFDKTILKKIKTNKFYKRWIIDMAQICSTFCETIKSKSVNFSIQTTRSCKRYHIDNVPMRLLVTYYGIGTEWLPSSASNYSAYYNGENNENITIDHTKIKFINAWDIAVFKGQKYNGKNEGILHRTPNASLKNISLLMCLDYPDFHQELI